MSKRNPSKDGPAEAENQPRPTVHVLWVDDEPEQVTSLHKALQAAGGLIRIDVATSLGEARSMLASPKEYAALVVDCKIDSDEGEQNGAAYAREISRQTPGFPILIVSGFLSQARYRSSLDETHSILEEQKPARVSRPVMDSELFRRLYEAATNYLEWKTKNPEQVTFNEYVKNHEKYEGLSRAHWGKHRLWINQWMTNKGLAWVVVCGGEVVEQSSRMDEFPDEARLEEIGRQKGFVPFAYAREVAPESIDKPPNCRWNETTEPGDSYPTIRIRIGRWQGAEDLDTGAYKTYVSDEIVRKGLWDSWRAGEHLGGGYDFCTKRIDIGVVGDDGTVEMANIPVNVVKRWGGTTFVKYNIHRRALVGRDLLRAIRMTVTLDSNDHETRVTFL